MVIYEPNAFKSIHGFIHEIVLITNITDEKTDGLQKVECETLYSSEPNRPGAGTIYFGDLSAIEVGQTYLASIIRHGESTVYATDSRLLLQDGFFYIDASTQFWSLEAMNSLVRDYLRSPDDKIPSIPQKELQGAVTVECAIRFLESMKAACTEWESAYWKSR